jgi:hypothetical protein
MNGMTTSNNSGGVLPLLFSTPLYIKQMNIEIAPTDHILTNWKDANSYCEHLDYGGKHDWRLPTVAELEELQQSSEYSYKEFYWANKAQSYFLSWATNMSTGLSKLIFKDYKAYVLPVRTVS